MQVKLLTTLAAAALTLAGITPGMASANPSPAPRLTVINDDVMTPLQLATSGTDVFVSDRIAGQVRKIAADGSSAVLTTQPGREVNGVGVDGAGRVAYVWAQLTRGTVTASGLAVVGTTAGAADLLAFERSANPDKNRTYGLVNATTCQSNGLKAAGIPVTYRGGVASRPVAVADLGTDWAVADARANAILRVRPDGRVATITALPRQPLVITSAMASALKLPTCLVGATYFTEARPTDLAVMREGLILVTVAPPALGKLDPGRRGSVYRIDPATRSVTKIVADLAAPTNLAVKTGGDERGTMYIAESGSDTITKYGPDAAYMHDALTLPGILAVEIGAGHLYLTTDVPRRANGTPEPGQTGRVYRLF